MQTVDPAEIERFSKLSSQWWNPEGPLAPLHVINPLRLTYVRDLAMRHFKRDESPKPLSGLSVLDIGCGGGLMCEPLARLGAHVTGIDASETNIGVAKAHAEAMGLAIDYRCTTAEEISGTFDVVLALEIIEHVADPAGFVQACANLAKPGGLIIFSTINRTPKAYALAIIGAEYILRWLPRGTHDFRKFVRPSELAAWLRTSGAEVMEMQGMTLNPLTFKWSLKSGDVSVNYVMAATKLSS